MKKKVRIIKTSRKHLADPKLGMKYNDRLERTKLDINRHQVEIIDCENGYSILKKKEMV